MKLFCDAEKEALAKCDITFCIFTYRLEIDQISYVTKYAKDAGYKVNLSSYMIEFSADDWT